MNLVLKSRVNMPNIVIATSKNWYPHLKSDVEKALNCKITWIDQKQELTLNALEQQKPDYIFFPHWSYLIPEEIFTQFECIIFHMTDVPFGRGGSPMQNLIARGIYETQLTALKCAKALDAGPVYLKRALSLHGNAEEIFYRANRMMVDMVVNIVTKKIIPQPQKGEVVNFKRRTKDEGNILCLESLDKIYDYIRMLDAEGYPKAFLEFGDYRIEFSRANFKKDKIIADVEIRKKTSD